MPSLLADKLSMNNPHNVDILFDPKAIEKGLLKRRTYAFTLDLFAVALINKGILIAYTNFLQSFFYQLPIHAQQSIIGEIPKASFFTLTAVFFSYFLMSFYLGEGKTPGKLFFGLRVYSPKKLQDTLTLKESSLRSLGYFLCYATGLFLFLAPFMRKDRKGVPDWFSGTQTISEERFLLLKNLKAKEEAEQLEKDEEEQLSLFDEAA